MAMFHKKDFALSAEASVTELRESNTGQAETHLFYVTSTA